MGGKKHLIPRSFVEEGNRYLAVTLKGFVGKHLRGYPLEATMNDLSAIHAPDLFTGSGQIPESAPFDQHIYRESRKLQLIWEIICPNEGDVQISWLDQPEHSDIDKEIHLLQVRDFLAWFGCDSPEARA